VQRHAMKTETHRNPANVRGRRMARHAVVAWLASLCAVALFEAAHGDTFSKVYYDAGHDELVVTMAYRGTNPDHAFSLKWGACQTTDQASEPEIVAEVLDSQWQDAARQPFKVTTRFSLADLPCRPVKLTLRTAPRFYASLHIPAQNR
jgi:hypothetical protein